MNTPNKYHITACVFNKTQICLVVIKKNVQKNEYPKKMNTLEYIIKFKEKYVVLLLYHALIQKSIIFQIFL